MNRFAKLALLLCFALAASGVSRAALAATADTQTSARLDALEKENAALRARVNRLEASTTAIRRRSAAAQSNPALASCRDRKTQMPWPPARAKSPAPEL